VKEYVTVLFDDKSVVVKRVAMYHPSKPDGPVLVEFEVFVGPRRVARLPTLKEAMQFVEVGLSSA
jgi:hypothetical protein